MIKEKEKKKDWEFNQCLGVFGSEKKEKIGWDFFTQVVVVFCSKKHMSTIV